MMEDYRREQLDVLETLAEYNGKVIKNIKILIKELSGQRLEDTDNFQNGILEAVNWEIQVVNGTTDILNEGKVRVDTDKFNACVTALSRAVQEKDDKQRADSFAALLTELVRLGEAVHEVLSK